MGIASFSPSFSPSKFGVPGVPTGPMMFAPIQALAAFFMPARAAQSGQRSASPTSALRVANTQAASTRVPALSSGAPASQPVHRLKVIREFEPGMRPFQSGRMAISGRMADVCAELDRIASKESSK